MTENEAIKELETSIDLAKMCTQNYERKREIQGYEMAINALEEVQKYRAIGTPEECRAAMERQNPRAAITEKEDTGTTKYTCPACGRYMGWSTGSSLPARYCWKCGQKLDWGDEE